MHGLLWCNTCRRITEHSSATSKRYKCLECGHSRPAPYIRDVPKDKPTTYLINGVVR